MMLLWPGGFIASGQPHENHGLQTDSHEENHGPDDKDAYNPGKKIIEHIVDSHDWHILSYRTSDGHKHHVSIPLPIILIDEGKLVTFWSNKFHHGHSSYKGYRLESKGENKGKIVRADQPEVVPLDFSITKNVAAIIISSLLLCLIFISVARTYKRREGEAPKGLQSFLEPAIIFIRDDVAKSSIGKNYERYMPYLLTLFFFILLNNLLGLVPIFPGGANVTGNLAVTGVMALFTLLITSFSGNRAYWQHIFNTPGVPWWLKIPIPLIPIIEVLGAFTKPFVLMVRLFANITAGHIIILGFISLIFIFGNMNIYLGYGVSVVSVLFSVFLSLLEILVAFIQAYVFTLLSALYFGMATEEHH
jgi:F-type H+-transporting ATPase subunit a